MAFTPTPRGPETDAILAALAAVPLLAGDAIRPAGGGFNGEDPTKPFKAYCVVYAGIVQQYDGPSGDPYADTVNEYQITSVGATRAQCQWVADKAAAALVKNPPLAVTGRNVQLVEPVSSQPVTRDDDVTPPVFFKADLYAIHTTPA